MADGRRDSSPLPQILVVPQVLPHAASQAQVSGVQVRQYGDAQFRRQHLQVYKAVLLFA